MPRTLPSRGWNSIYLQRLTITKFDHEQHSIETQGTEAAIRYAIKEEPEYAQIRDRNPHERAEFDARSDKKRAREEKLKELEKLGVLDDLITVGQTQPDQFKEYLRMNLSAPKTNLVFFVAEGDEDVLEETERPLSGSGDDGRLGEENAE